MEQFLEVLTELAPSGMPRALILWLAVSYFAVSGFFHLRRAIRETLHDRSILEREKARLEILRLKAEILRMGGPREQRRLRELIVEALGLDDASRTASAEISARSSSVEVVVKHSQETSPIQATPGTQEGVGYRRLPAIFTWKLPRVDIREIIERHPSIALAILVPLNAVTLAFGALALFGSLGLVLLLFTESNEYSSLFLLATMAILMAFSAACFSFTHRTVAVWRAIRGRTSAEAAATRNTMDTIEPANQPIERTEPAASRPVRRSSA